MKNQHNVSPGRKGYINTFIFGGMEVTMESEVYMVTMVAVQLNVRR